MFGADFIAGLGGIIFFSTDVQVRSPSFKSWSSFFGSSVGGREVEGGSLIRRLEVCDCNCGDCIFGYVNFVAEEKGYYVELKLLLFRNQLWTSIVGRYIYPLSTKSCSELRVIGKYNPVLILFTPVSTTP